MLEVFSAEAVCKFMCIKPGMELRKFLKWEKWKGDREPSPVSLAPGLKLFVILLR